LKDKNLKEFAIKRKDIKIFPKIASFSLKLESTALIIPVDA
jgi:hypothetical protein